MLNPAYVKPLLRRAKLYEELDQLSQALEDYKELEKLDPNNTDVKTALRVLPKRIEEQTEKLKEEMIGMNRCSQFYLPILIFKILYR